MTASTLTCIETSDMSVVSFNRQHLRRHLVAVVGTALSLAAGGAGAAETPSEVAVHPKPRAIESFEFRDGSGDRFTLRDFRGQVVVLNLWATWCPPCREEMPTLDELQQRLGGEDFEVVALSLDRQGLEPVRKFYDEIGVDNLRLYIGSPGDVMARLRVRGMPTTLVVDRRGREVARVVGKADWSTPQMIDYLRGLIGRGPAESASAPAQRGDSAAANSAGVPTR